MSDGQMVREWEQNLEGLHRRIGQRFKRREPRERAYRYLKGLLSTMVRKNGWQLAEQAGESRPDGMQRLLSRAVWDVDGVRDDGRAYVVEHLAMANGVVVLDETGFLKKGEHSVGVKRQYSGTAGGIENCQIGVFLAYATARGHALIDRELYLPRDWIDDPARRKQADVPEDIVFATKTQLGRRMLERAFAAQIPHQWITGDAIYGDDRRLRAWLEEQREWYVLGVTRDEMLYYDGARQRYDEIAATLPLEAWQQLSCGAGTKGERLYDWALVTWRRANQAPDAMHAFLVRRNITDPTDEAYFRVFAPAGTPLSTLVQVAGQRWTVEECFELAKGEVGLDQYEVRQWPGWYRHITLAMLALAFLVVVRQMVSQQEAQKKRVRFPATRYRPDGTRNSPLASRPPVAGQTALAVRVGLVALAACASVPGQTRPLSSSATFPSSYALS
jgi:SRSO17 transposase